MDGALGLDLAVFFGMTADESAELEVAEQARRVKRGDRSAFEALVRSVQRPVFGLCLRLLGNEAEASEAAQEALLRGYQNLDRYDESRSFELWMLAIARNHCLDVLRRRPHMRTDDVDELHERLPAREPNQEEQAIATQTRHSLEEAMATLPVEDREVLALYYVQKRTTKEIAGVLGCAPGTIMARLFRAREKLRKRMKEQEAV
jgi:RNA polymerase sigma-70 factor (ECF subfamily)